MSDGVPAPAVPTTEEATTSAPMEVDILHAIEQQLAQPSIDEEMRRKLIGAVCSVVKKKNNNNKYKNHRQIL